MKEFNLELAKAGAKVQTRDGSPARIICYDIVGERPIGVLVTSTTPKGEKFEVMHAYYGNGAFNRYADSDLDLVMASTKKEGWVNLYKDSNGAIICKFHNTKEDALLLRCENYIATKKIEWEE